MFEIVKSPFTVGVKAIVTRRSAPPELKTKKDRKIYSFRFDPLERDMVGRYHAVLMLLSQTNSRGNNVERN